MKYFVIISMVMSLFILSTGSFAQDTDGKTGTLTVVVTSVKNNDGLVMVAICNSEEAYTSDEEEPSCTGRAGEIENEQSTVVFEDLPLGEYAIKLFHDENENGELDTNFLGIPKEDYAFSNNAKGSFGPPKYEKAKFDVTGDLTIELTLASEE